jgi:DNA repair exonuclease SbcCD ATPase subunit
LYLNTSTLAAKPLISDPSAALQSPPLPPPSHIDSLEQDQINRKLQSDIEELVSAHIDTAHKVYDMETENESLRKKLQTAEEELALLQDSIKHAEGREQAVIGLLNEAETARNGAQDACAQALTAIQELLDGQRVIEAAKFKAEAELNVLRGMFRAVEGQLVRAEQELRSRPEPFSKPTVDVAVQSEPLRSDTEASAQAHRLAIACLTAVDLQDASSVDQDETCSTPVPSPDYMHHPNPGMADFHNIPGLLDAFKDIDNLVRTAFDAS